MSVLFRSCFRTELFPPQRAPPKKHAFHVRQQSNWFSIVVTHLHEQHLSKVYLKFHSVLDDWSIFAQTKIHVVFIDAAHDYASVKSDLEKALALPHVAGSEIHVDVPCFTAGISATFCNHCLLIWVPGTGWPKTHQKDCKNRIPKAAFPSSLDYVIGPEACI